MDRSRIASEGNGTRIEGYFDLARQVRLFVRIWLAAVVAIGVPIFVTTLLDAAKGSRNLHGAAWVGLAVPAGLVAFGLLLPKAGRLLGRPEESAVLEHIQNTLGTRLEANRSS